MEAQLWEIYSKTEACLSSASRESHMCKEADAELQKQEAREHHLRSEEASAMEQIQRLSQEIESCREKKDEKGARIAETLEELRAHNAAIKATLEALDEQLNEARAAHACEEQDAKVVQSECKQVEESFLQKRRELTGLKEESEELELEISDIQKETKALASIISGAQTTSGPIPRKYTRGAILGDFLEESRRDPRTQAFEKQISELLASCDSLEDSLAQRSAVAATSQEEEQRALLEEANA